MENKTQGGTRERTIISILKERFQPTHLDVVNESHMHSVPAGAETHFRVLIVSQEFSGLSRVARQRLVNDALKEQLQSGLHALAQKTLTPEEYLALGDRVEFQSPPCAKKK